MHGNHSLTPKIKSNESLTSSRSVFERDRSVWERPVACSCPWQDSHSSVRWGFQVEYARKPAEEVASAKFALKKEDHKLKSISFMVLHKAFAEQVVIFNIQCLFSEVNRHQEMCKLDFLLLCLNI